MSDIAYTNSPNRGGSTPMPTKDMPLTAELKDRTDSAIASANRIHNTLYTLRDRLFGSGPGNPMGTGNEAASPYAFSDVMRDLNRGLSARLNEIEELAESLASRL